MELETIHLSRRNAIKHFTDLSLPLPPDDRRRLTLCRLKLPRLVRVAAMFDGRKYCGTCKTIRRKRDEADGIHNTYGSGR